MKLFEGGSSQTLDEAIMRIVCMRPPNDIPIEHYVEGVLRDFMAQKFNRAMLRNIESENVILDLWNSIFPERAK